MNWSIINKRVTSYVLIILGIYMGLMEYELMYVVLFLGSGLLNIGMAIWYNVNKDPDHPPPDDDLPPGGN